MMILREPLRPPKRRFYRAKHERTSAKIPIARLALLPDGSPVEVECLTNLAALFDGFDNWSDADCPCEFEWSWFASRCTHIHTRQVLRTNDTPPTIQPVSGDSTRPLLKENRLLPRNRDLHRWSALIEWIGGERAEQRWGKFTSSIDQSATDASLREALFRICNALIQIRQLHLQFGPQSCVRNIERLSREIMDSNEDFTSNLRSLFYFVPNDVDDQLLWINKTFEKAKKDWLQLERDDRTHFSAIAASVFLDADDDSIIEKLIAFSARSSKWMVRRLFERIDAVPRNQMAKIEKRFDLLAVAPDESIGNLLSKRRVPKQFYKTCEVDYERLSQAFDSDPLRRRLTGLTHGEFAGFFGKHVDRRIVSAWLDWLEKWPNRSITPIQASGWQDVLRQLSNLNRLTPSVGERWEAWLASLSREGSKKVPVSTAVHSNMETQQAYRYFTLYRSVAGLGAKPSRRLQKFLFINESRKRELEYLERQVAQGTVTERAALRLNYLRQNPRLKFVPSRKLRRELHSGAMHTSLQAAQTWIRKRAASVLTQWRIPWSKPLSAQESEDFVHFISGLGFGTKQVLIRGLQTNASYSSGYRMLGDKNQEWIRQAERRGLRPALWLDFPSCEIDVQEQVSSGNEPRKRRLWIRLSNDPRDVLWMGRPFSSCLDLRGGLHSASVVANWMDANKQLLVVSDSSGRMIARKLLALTEDLGMLGYHLYSSLTDPEIVEQHATAPTVSLQEHIKRYCAALAEAIGAKLVDEGTPKSLHGSQWYNDGEEAW